MTLHNLREIGTILASVFVHLFFFHRKPPLNPRAIKKILIIKLDHIGDVLLATPVFRNLHEHYPDAEIDLLIGSWSRPVVKNIPYLNRVWEYDSPFFCRSSNGTSFSDRIELVKQLRKRKHELIVELRGDLFTAVISPFISRYRIDRATLQLKEKSGRIFPKCSDVVDLAIHSEQDGVLRGARLRNNTKMGLRQITEPRYKHEVDRNLYLLEHYGIQVKSRQIVFDITEEKVRWAKSFLGRIGNSKELVAIHPGSPVALKRWSSGNFSQLADSLIDEKNVQIIFVGTGDDKPIIDEIQSKMRYDSINLAGKTDLQELGAILQICDLFIGNDSAPMHVASAVGTDTISLFGPSSPERFAPYGKHCQVLRKTNCPPCMSEKCRLGIRCVDEISVKDVLEVAKG